MLSPTKQAKLKQLLAQLNKKTEPPQYQSFQLVSPDLFDTLEAKIEEVKKSSDTNSLVKSIKEIKADMKRSEQELQTEFESRFATLPDITESLTPLKEEFEAKVKTLQEQYANSIQSVEKQLTEFITTDSKEDELEKAELEKKFKEIRADVISRIAGIGGGAMNRKINFNGTDRLTRYTDINWKAGNNVTFTITNNNATKMVDVTVASTGGGSGSGIVRSIQSISLSQVADAASTTDYVYLCTGTLTLTLPDASTNSNLYTVKNVGTGVVTINTTSSQTIDGNLTITMPIQYTSVDLTSDTANWVIT